MRKYLPLPYLLSIILVFCQGQVHASFIEQTLGTAVVRDATAVYFNPAALTVLPKQQLVVQSTFAKSQFQFSGNAERLATGISESGKSSSISRFVLPSLYTSFPVNDRFSAGFAMIINDFNRDLDGAHSVLRYVQPGNQTKNLDLVPALGIKINRFLAVGANINFSHAQLIQEPISGIAALNIPESRSLNNSQGNSLGGDFGVLLKPGPKTALGFNYRSAVTYHLQGSSTLARAQIVSSNNYHFKYWTPARTVLSFSHFFNEKFGLTGTAQYLQWDIFKNGRIYNFVTQSAAGTLIVPEAPVHYDFHNAWIMTLGSIYNISTQWTIRFAGTYNQSPSTGRFQIGTGDSLVTGASMGYQLMKNLAMDCSYGHAFFRKKGINIATEQNSISGGNAGRHDSISLKFTLTA